MHLSNIIIVLSRPSEPGNTGAVCRVMKNLRLSRLRLAKPEFNFEKSDTVIRARAVHAADVWESAETFSSLSEAVADCAIVIGTTQRRGQRRKQTMTPEESYICIDNTAYKVYNSTAMSGKDCVKLLKKHGWVLERVRGSHHIMLKNGIAIPVPVHGSVDLAPGTLNSILKKAGLK